MFDRPDLPGWEVSHGVTTVFALGSESSLDEVSGGSVMSTATQAEQTDALEIWVDILDTYAPGATEKIRDLDLSPGIDEVFPAGDTLVRVFAGDDGSLDFGVRALASEGIPIGSRPLASSSPLMSPAALASSSPLMSPPQFEMPRSFSGARDFNTPKFPLVGGDYFVSWSVEAGRSCFVAFDLKSSIDSFDVAAEVATGHVTGTNNLYDVPAGDYYFAAQGDCPWFVSIAPQRELPTVR
jgi:hypothetical protein